MCVLVVRDSEPWGCSRLWYTVAGTNFSNVVTPIAVSFGGANNRTATLRLDGLVHADAPWVRLWAVDTAGNVGTVHTLWTWRVDSVAPQASLQQFPARVTADSTASLVFGCSKAACVYDCYVDGALVSLSSGGSASGSASTTSVTLSAVVDASSSRATPSRSITFTSLLAMSNGSVIVPSATSGNATVRVRVDSVQDAAWMDVRSLESDAPSASGAGAAAAVRFAVSVSGEGRHVAQFSAAGSALSDVTPVHFVWLVDTVAPVVEFAWKPSVVSSVPSGIARFVVACSEVAVVLHYRVAPTVRSGNGTWATTTGAVIDVAGLTAGVSYTFDVYAVDAAGNVGPALVWRWSSGVCPEQVDVFVSSVTSHSVSAGQRLVLWSTELGAAEALPVSATVPLPVLRMSSWLMACLLVVGVD